MSLWRVCRGAAKAKVTNTSIIQQGGLMMLNGAIACGAGYLIAWAIAEMMVSTDRLLTIFLAGLRSHIDGAVLAGQPDTVRLRRRLSLEVGVVCSKRRRWLRGVAGAHG